VFSFDGFQSWPGAVFPGFDLQLREGGAFGAAKDKLADVWNAAEDPAIASQTGGAALSGGFNGALTFPTTDSSAELGEPVHCGVIGGASRWYSYLAPTDGILTVSTEGSGFDTILAVYTGPTTNLTSLHLEACDYAGGTDGKFSLVQFPVT